MKIRSAIIVGIIVIVVIGIVTSLVGTDQSIHENKIRVAFFPNIGHVVPIVGYETGIFSEGLGNNTLIETKIFDSGPQVIESIFANSIDIAYVGPGPAINGIASGTTAIASLLFDSSTSSLVWTAGLSLA